MFKPYVPSSDELEMVKQQRFLRPKLNDISTQEGLIASLVHDINSFDYFYEYSDDGNTWRIYDKKKESIEERLENVEDELLRQKLSSCFNKDKHKDVLKLVSWGKYLHKGTKYVYLRWDEIQHNKACRLVALQEHIETIISRVIAGGVQGRVIYSDNIPLAHKKLREGVTWFDTDIPLMSAAISSELYSEMQMLVCWYKAKMVTYADIRTLYPHYAEIMLTDFAEIIRLRNFYFMVSYPTFNAA